MMGARLLLVMGREADVFRVAHGSTPSHGSALAKWENDVTMPQASKVNVAHRALTDKGGYDGF